MHILLLLHKTKTLLTVIMLLLSSLISITYICSALFFKNIIPPNTYIETTNIGLKNENEISDVLTKSFPLPSEIKITIDEETKILNTQEVELKLNLTAEEIFNLYSSKAKPFDIIHNIKILTSKKQLKIKRSLNEVKLEKWIKLHFTNLNLRQKVSPLIKIDENNIISNCNPGIGSIEIPIKEIKNKLLNDQILSPVAISENTIYNQLNADEIEINTICNSIENFKNKLEKFDDQIFLTEEEVKELFEFKFIENNIQGSIKDQTHIVSKLTELKTVLDIEPYTPHYKEYNGQLFLLGKYKQGRYLDVQKTLDNLEKQLYNIKNFNDFKGIYTETQKPKLINNQNYFEYPTLVSEGMGRFSMFDGGWTKRESTRDNIIRGLSKIDGQIIPANTEVSLTDMLDAKIVYYDKNMDNLAVLDGNIAYGAGICGVSTVVFRASLEAGFEIKERHGHQQALRNYQYPYGGLVDAALFFYNDYKEDLKVINNTNNDVLIVANAWTDENSIFNYKVQFFSDENFTKKDIRLDDFYREDHYKGGGFKESFVRYIDGVAETFETKYYMSDF